MVLKLALLKVTSVKVRLVSLAQFRVAVAPVMAKVPAPLQVGVLETVSALESVVVPVEES